MHREGSLRSLLTILGALLVLAGAVWFVQGIGILPGSFMTGQIRWAIYGGLAVVVGLVLLALARRTPRGDQH